MTGATNTTHAADGAPDGDLHNAPLVPPHALRDYAFLADGYRGANLVGGRGCYLISPADTYVWGGYYESGSLIWRSRWTTTRGRIESREALTVPSDPHTLTLLRRVENVDGPPARVDVRLDLRARFGTAPNDIHSEGGGAWSITTGGLHCRWSGAVGARHDGDGSLRLTLELAAGERRDFSLEISDQPLGASSDPDRLWSETQNYWHQNVPDFAESAAPRDSQHAYAVLRGLTAPEAA